MPFLREDLMYNHYKWNSGFGFIGSPSRRLFDRSDGQQVLFIINFLGSLNGHTGLKEGRRLEELIRNKLPDDMRSEMSVFNWLRDIR